jgi:hypothetical protein
VSGETSCFSICLAPESSSTVSGSRSAWALVLNMWDQNGNDAGERDDLIAEERSSGIRTGRLGPPASRGAGTHPKSARSAGCASARWLAQRCDCRGSRREAIPTRTTAKPAPRRYQGPRARTMKAPTAIIAAVEMPFVRPMINCRLDMGRPGDAEFGRFSLRVCRCVRRVGHRKDISTRQRRLTFLLWRVTMSWTYRPGWTPQFVKNVGAKANRAPLARSALLTNPLLQTCPSGAAGHSPMPSFCRSVRYPAGSPDRRN